MKHFLSLESPDSKGARFLIIFPPNLGEYLTNATAMVLEFTDISEILSHSEIVLADWKQSPYDPK